MVLFIDGGLEEVECPAVSGLVGVWMVFRIEVLNL
jgi:hypothetical protein